MSNLIRQKLIVAIDHSPVVSKSSNYRSLLFLPEGEMHELGLLYLNYLLRKNHHQVMYLGQNVPFRDLEKVLGVCRPHYVFSIFTTFPHPSEVAGYIDNVSKLLPDGKLFLSGYLIQDYSGKVPQNVELINELSGLRTVINDQLGLTHSATDN